MFRQRSKYQRNLAVPLWTTPALIVVLAVVAAELAPRLDDHINGHLLPSISSRLSASVVTSVLTAVATGMIAFTGFVFTIVLLAVQFGTSTFSARLVPFFQRDRVIRTALGVFTATFIYCIVAATVVVPKDHDRPLVTVVIAQLLALASVFLFFGLMARIVTLLRAVGLLRVVGRMGRRAIDEAHPQAYVLTATVPTDQSSASGSLDGGNGSPGPEWIVHHKGEPGVLLHVELDRIVGVAVEFSTRLSMLAAIGDFVAEGAGLVRCDVNLPPEAQRQIERAMRFGVERTIQGSPAFALRVLADVAVKSLPPVTHDPTTAVQALDYIEDLLRTLALRHLGQSEISDETGIARLAVRLPDWNDYLSLGLDEVRLNAGSSLQVVRRLRAVLIGLAGICPPDRQSAVSSRLAALDTAAAENFPISLDRAMAALPDQQGLGGATRAQSD